MRKVFLLIGCAVVMFAVSGCSEEPGPVTTDPDEIAAYNAMINDPANMGEDDAEEEEEAAE